MAEQEYTDETGKYVKCEKCGAVFGDGAFPFCKGNPADHGKMHGFDDPFEPHVDVQLLPKTDPRCRDTNELGIRGVWIGSRSERRAIMKEQGLQFGTQKFDEKRGNVIYGGIATSPNAKGGPGFRRRH